MSPSEQETLVARIVSEVLHHLRAGAERTDDPPLVRVAVVLSATASRGALDVLRAVGEGGYAVGEVACGVRMPPQMLADVRSIAPVVDASAAGQGPSADTVALVAPEFAVTDAAKLGLGILDDAPAEWVWRALAAGLPVYASPGDGFGADLPSPLARLAAGHRAACARLGVAWVRTDGLCGALAAHVSPGRGTTTFHVPLTERRLLITEEMVGRLPHSTRELAVPRGAILTPLARDMARRRGIRIEHGS
jgi:hypothetical protein